MKLIITLAVVALTCIYFEITEQNRLEDSSADFAEWIQSGRTTTSDLFFEIVGGVMGVIFVIMGGIVFLIGKREEGIIGISSALFGSALSATLKIALSHPRPFWKYSKVLGIECPRDYGAPSGHALSAGCGLLVFGTIWLRSGGQFSRKIFVILFLIIVTAFDRVYLGVHFYFQVILGYSIAALCAAILLHPRFWRFIHKIGSDKHALSKAAIVSFGYFILSSMLYMFGGNWDPLWSQNYEEKCKRPLTLNDALIKNYSETLHIWLIVGILFGYFYLKEKNGPPFSYQLLAVSAFLHIAMVGTVVAGDALMIKKMTGLSRIISMIAIRFVGGFLTTYFCPMLLTKIYGIEKTIRTGLPTRKGNTFDTKTKALN